jgi:hypothetical protein
LREHWLFAAAVWNTRFDAEGQTALRKIKRTTTDT